MILGEGNRPVPVSPQPVIIRSSNGQQGPGNGVKGLDKMILTTSSNTAKTFKARDYTLRRAQSH